MSDDSDPFHALEMRIMKAQRDAKKDAYREKIKNMTPAEFEAERKRTAELLARSPYRKKK